jgi:hypothetical protein
MGGIINVVNSTAVFTPGAATIAAANAAANAAAQVPLAAAQVALATTQAGIATAAAGTAGAQTATQRASALVANITAAAKAPSAIKLLVTKDGTITYRGGSTVNIDQIAPLIGPANLLAGVGFDGSGPATAPPPTPIATAAGLQMHHQSGFILSNAVIANTGNFAIDMVITWPAVAATFANVAAMNAALATWPVGALVYVSNPVIPVSGNPDQTDNLLGINTAGGAVTGGYYLRGNGAWDTHNAFLFEVTDGSNRCEVTVSPVGQLSGFVYAGSGAGAQVVQFYRDVIAFRPGSAQSLRLESDGTAISIYWNGEEVGTIYSQASFVPTTWYINGNNHTAGTGTGTIPVNLGASYTLGALCVSQGLDYTQRRLVSNVLADTFGTPRVLWSETADVVIHIDQSRTSAPENSTTGDPNRPDSASNWNGMLTRRRTNDPLGINPSQEVLPGVYSSGIVNDATRNPEFGPLCCSNNVYGQSSNAVGTFTQSGSGGETIEWGFAKQWRLAEGGRQNHLYFIGMTIGGQTLAYLQSKSGAYLHSLLGTSMATLQPRDWTNRSLIALRKRCHARGQRLRCIVLSDLQGETDVAIVGTAALHETDTRQWWDAEISKLVDLPSPPPLMLFKSPDYSYDGTGLGGNTSGSNYVLDAYRRLGLNKDTGHRLRTLTSIYAWAGRFIHWSEPRIRLIGEVMGDLARRAWHEGNDVDSLQVVTAVRSGANIILTTNRPVAIVSQALPTVLSTLTTGGFNTYGLVFEPTSGGRTISGAVTLDGTGKIITVPISGGGPIANDRINVTGTGALWTNFREATRRYGQYPDQNWTAIPFASAAPTLDYSGPLNELTEWLSPSSHVLT